MLDAQELMKFRSGQEGFEFIAAEKVGELFKRMDQGFFQSRYDCENDELVLQPIPYILLFNSQREVFSYVRAENITDYGDTRLFGKHSLGLGGHINREDAPNYVLNCLLREFKEEVKISESNSEPLLLGTLFVCCIWFSIYSTEIIKSIYSLCVIPITIKYFIIIRKTII